MGHARWQHWSYHEALARFCAQTNITFDPFLLVLNAVSVCEAIMNCAEISKLIGYTCYPLNDDDTVALIDTSVQICGR